MKKIVVIIVILIILLIVGLWIGGIIPKTIARIVATNYLKNKFPMNKFEYSEIEWSSAFDGYSIRFKDEKGQYFGLIMNGKYFPFIVGQGINAIEEYNR